MRLLAVPNWSFGPTSPLREQFSNFLAAAEVQVHYHLGDVDHNRTVTAFSGDLDEVEATLNGLADIAFSHIDMREHQGVHPRVGALDVCPLIVLEGDEFEAKALAERFAAEIAACYELPVYLYEKSERGRHEGDLPTLRKGGYEGIRNRRLKPDFGPNRASLALGASIVGVRDFLIAMNVDLRLEEPATARAIARELRDVRQEGDVRLLGVRALGFPLQSRKESQVSLNLTLPNVTKVDEVVQWVADRAAERAVEIVGTELIGVIRERDLPTATLIHPIESQIIR